MASLTDSLTLLVTPKTLRRKTVAIVSVTLGAFLVVLHVFSRIVLLEWTLGPDESATLQKAKMHKGVGTQCAKVEAALEPGREVCADAVTWLPTRTEMLIPYNPLRTCLVNAEYQSAASKQLRRTLRAFEGSDLTVEVRVGEVAPNLDPDESAFLPPPGAVSSDWCADAAPPRVVEKPGPHYPRAAMANRQQGVVSVYAIVGVDRSPHDLRVVRSAGQDFDAATLAAVARWRYRPAVCGDKPIQFEKVVDVTYSLRE